MLLAVSDPVSLAEEEASSVLDDVSSAEAVELLSSLALALAADAEEVMDSVLAALLCACEEVAVVEEAAASPAQVAAVGRLLTPWPAQRELANWRVSVGVSVAVRCLIIAFLFQRTVLVLLAARLANAAREAAEQLGVAADALDVERVARPEAVAYAAGGAGRQAGDLRGGEGGEEGEG